MDLLRANLVKIVQKKAASSLADGEQVLAVVMCQEEGTTFKQALTYGTASTLGGAVGRGLHDALVDSKGGEVTAPPTSMAECLPTGALLVTWTDRRVLVFTRSSMRDRNPKDLAAELPAGAIVAAERGKGKLGTLPLTLRFTDGSETVVDAGSLNRWDEVDAAIAGQAGRG